MKRKKKKLSTSCDASESSGWLAQNHVASDAQNDSLSVAKHGGNLYAAFSNDTLHIYIISSLK